MFTETKCFGFQLLTHLYLSFFPGTTMLLVIIIFLLHTPDAAAEVWREIMMNLRFSSTLN